MDGYEFYCRMDPFFYDRLTSAALRDSDYARTIGPAPDGWLRHVTDTWVYHAPEDAGDLPAQGWKIHVSARHEDAVRALDLVWEHCVGRRIAFKHLRGAPALLAQNSKTADRASSGKFITVYPRDEAELELALKELDELLDGIEGPYILSDLRYGTGPLHVRYGAFAERHCLDERGERVLALENGEGELVPDVRGVAFAVPPWIRLPAFLEPHLEARNAVTVAGLPYEIENVVQFSNGGGVYFGHDRDGRRVILKESRPHAGLDAMNRDAVARSRHERDILRRLEGLDVVPELVDHFVLGGHEFLVTGFVDGEPLQRMLVNRYPLSTARPEPEALAEYTAWACEILPKVEQAVAALHARGVVFGDLHPENILVTAEGRPVLIDFEVASPAADDARPALAHPAFLAPAGRSGVEADRYALACLVLGLFAPQVTITLPLDPGKAARLGALITETFPVPPRLIEDAVRVLTGGRERGAPRAAAPSALDRAAREGSAAWPELRDELHRTILASATPERGDRLFPGDVAQFRGGGAVNIATGAAGVLLALYETGAGRFPQYEDWLLDRALRPGNGLGLYDGVIGVAHVLHRLGRRDDALELAGRCLDEHRLNGHRHDPGLSLYSGLSGLALGLLGLGLADPAREIVRTCAERIGGPDGVPGLSGGRHPRAGLMHGSSGAALLFLHAYELDGDPALLDLARDALAQDLRRCRRGPDGSLQVDQGWRLLPYLEEGSAGIVPVLSRYLSHRDDPRLAGSLAGLRAVAGARFFVQPGLFNGRAGLIAALPPGDPDLPGLVAGLRWHALVHQGGTAFPGDRLLRLSMDFATGTAGVLFALGHALDAAPCFLPLMQPPGTADRKHRAAPPSDTWKGGA
ncbi:class III lanthionine synthetase LanKC [Actinocorallia populi]|uniref:class III lanthionine synthetase LanKC n=1 Tax=Actinocorallia populi TaxID=2079200 RepID=UPI000D097BE0|nr:class III lanthionine synthetase LanKC [Actinocorallia populi]